MAGGMTPTGDRGAPARAGSSAYRKTTVLERLGVMVSRVVGNGALRRVLRAAYHGMLGGGSGALVSTLPHGEVVRVAPQYRLMSWNPIEYEAFRGALRPGDVALDIGANVGAYTLLFAQWVRPGGRVISFEPAPGAFTALQQHVALNNVSAVVECRPVAVSDAEGEVAFASDGFQGTNHIMHGQAASPGAVTRVPTTTVDAVCAASGVTPRLVKIDVEGAELSVLRGAHRTLAAMRPAGVVFMELHPAAWASFGITRGDLEAELAAQGLRVEGLRTGIDPWSMEGECVRLVPT
jgi:FkbM family methyltransferase